MHHSNTVIDYPARDMTITVGAGMTFGQLKQTLHYENQQLPIDLADDSVPLGKLVADDISGPRQFGYGTLRDYVIGIEAVDGSGRVFHAGGRVVKNVAGYDLCRLLVGSRGELGTITQVTFKLKPLPEQQVLAIAGFRSLRALDSALERLNVSETTPVILDVVSRSAGIALLSASVPELSGTVEFRDAAALLVVGFEGPSVSCHWQCSILKDELSGTSAWTEFAADPVAAMHYCRIAQQCSQPTDAEAWMVRLTTLPSRVVSSIQVLEKTGCRIFGRAGNGVLFVKPVAPADADLPKTTESEIFRLLHSLVDDGVGAVNVLQSAAARSTPSSPAIQELSRKLRAVLGASPPAAG